MTDINKRMATGIIWMVCARLMDRSIGIVSTLILARLLVPADFGLVAMATAIGGILDLLGAFSFDLALIQKEKAESQHYNTVWTFNVLFGVLCGLLLVALAEPAAHFYREARLTDVVYVLSISYFISAFSNIGVVDFRKNLDFRTEFNFIFLKRIVTFVVTITCAYLLRSYWALLIGMTVGRIAGTILSYTMNSYRPKFTLSASKELFHFSKWLFVNNFLYFLLHDGCTFIIGRIFGVTTLGVYAVSYEISSLPSTELVAPINRATFPGFSKMRTTTEKASAYLSVLGMIALIIFPVGIGIAAVAEPLTLTALGPKWIAGIPLIQLLAIHGAISALRGNDGPVWLAMGKPRETTILVAMFLAVLFPALYFFVREYGIIGAGYSYLLANVPTQPYSLAVTRRLLGFKWAQLLQAIWRPIISVIAMYGCVVVIDYYLSTHGAALRLIVESVSGGALYSAFVLALWRLSGSPPGAEAFCIAKMRNALPARRLGRADADASEPPQRPQS